MRPFDYVLVKNQSMNFSFTSPTQGLIWMMTASIQAVWTGSPVGTLNLQVSNDNETFSTYTGSQVAVSGPGNFLWNLLTTPYPYVQVVYTASSGTGTMQSITVNGKGPS